MATTNYTERHIVLNNSFSQNADCHLEDSAINIRYFHFNSLACTRDQESLQGDNRITENLSFAYPVFSPAGKQKHDHAILLLHGLNERNWNKYLTWAEYLCLNTSRPVILFPIAFHINRSPVSWSTPRSLVNLLNFRRNRYVGDRSISFANVALSERISQSPERFYLSGRQTWADLTTLFQEIRSGRHPLFREGCRIDIFAYSIGAFLSQVALMANEKNLFSDSRLFMFCGGSIFRSMCGISRSIMDRAAFDRLQDYYVNYFGSESENRWRRDSAFDAFYRMIVPERLQGEREAFFASLGKRIKGIALAKDTVIPYHGVQEALGKENTDSSIQLLDFPFPYTHENPFPSNIADITAVNAAFLRVFSHAANFLQ
ncbi:DUF6051 family protein [Proteiniphilum sp. UBA1028]|jgi:hypothetical protein|uniref:DUF6051 family protein n=1 Tax=Proteiniphilum sp. UBA1028 TaxID=1947251 RepID=UPI0025DE1C2D|nr:DUF6051 family protein [Proteiniphilum sp. UBA1028]